MDRFFTYFQIFFIGAMIVVAVAILSFTFMVDNPPEDKRRPRNELRRRP
jgi:hypothetical protein